MQDLVTFLHADGLITRSESLAIKTAARDLHENPVRILRSLNIASPKDIQKCFKVYFNFPLVTDSLVDHLTGEYASLIPIDLAIHYSVFAFGEDGNKLFVGMEDPSDRSTREALRFFLDREIVASAANVYQLRRALDKLYGLDESASGLETVLDKARGAGAWSETERALFEKILQERAAREEEERKSITLVSVPNARPGSSNVSDAGLSQSTSSALNNVPTEPAAEEASALEQEEPLQDTTEPVPSAELNSSQSAEESTTELDEPLGLETAAKEGEPGYDLAHFDESLLEPFDEDAFEADPDYVELDLNSQNELDSFEDSQHDLPIAENADSFSAEHPNESIDVPALKRVAQRAQVKLALCKDIQEAISALNELLQPLAMAVLMQANQPPALLVNEIPIETSELDTEIAKVLRPLFARLEHLADRTLR